MKISTPGKSGFTLIEVLMALLVLTVGLLGLLQSVNISYEHTLRQRLRDEAVALAEEQLNAMRGNAELGQFTSAVRVTGGMTTRYAVTRSYDELRGSKRLTVAVRWGFKNLSATHEIYSIRKM